ncbi:MAG: hypothetical protein Q9186_002514 [Xanthomendoza sp. 1 TL-2023]
MGFAVRKVAVVGAGPAGIATAKHLLAEGHFEVIDVFEQQANTGGVWNYSSYAPLNELRVPQTSPHQPLEEPRWKPSKPGEGLPSKPIFVTPMYDKLESNIPHFMMKYSSDPSLEIEPLFAGHESVLQYLNKYAENVRHLIRFSTQVYDIKRQVEGGHDRWLACIKDLVSNKVSERLYDAIAVASGHHYVPMLPDIPGIRAWNQAYPNVISHSKYYRTPDGFRNKKTLVVGNSASGLDIATQISTVSKHPLLNSRRSKNTYQHLFHIKYPSLAFVGLPIKILPFRTFEGQAAIISRIWSGRLELPPESDMKVWECSRIADRGGGKKFHELGNLEDLRYHNELIDWALQARSEDGGNMPPKWNERDYWVRKNIPAIKKAFADQGAARHSVRSIEELGFMFQPQGTKGAT